LKNDGDFSAAALVLGGDESERSKAADGRRDKEERGVIRGERKERSILKVSCPGCLGYSNVFVGNKVSSRGKRGGI
jgi:hypothetical protein